MVGSNFGFITNDGERTRPTTHFSPVRSSSPGSPTHAPFYPAISPSMMIQHAALVTCSQGLIIYTLYCYLASAWLEQRLINMQPITVSGAPWLQITDSATPRKKALTRNRALLRHTPCAT